jgi:3-phenylpropionate/trans-cinnamate dioxygenase ferredoxin reductase component
VNREETASVADELGMVIVGAGECGARAALALREASYRGPVTLIGAEPHLPYERPPLSKAAMTADASQPKSIASREQLFEAAVMLLPSLEAVAVDRGARTVQLSNGALLPYSRLLLATGATPRRLPLAAGSANCVYLRTYDDALALRARLGPGMRVGVIGGGFIGLELAASARTLGAEVTVIEAAPRLLARAVPAEIAASVQARHESEGVRFRIGQTIDAVEDTRTGTVVTLAGGESIEADTIIVGIGAVPDTRLAEAAGLRTENGVAVDEQLRTSDPAVFAAGDCCSFPLALYGGRRVRLESWRNAQEQGALAAKNMLGAGEPHAAVPWFWSDQYDLGLQIAGLPDEGQASVRREMGRNAFILFHLAGDGRLVAASGIGPGNAVARDIRLAEMMIARRAKPEAEKLAAPETKLKSLLAA